MTSEQAKEVLALYRPGTSDAQDPAFAEALELTRRDPELDRWFQQHCQLYAAIRAKFKATRVPEGLKEQILAERKVNLPGFWRRPIVLPTAALAAVVAIVAVVLWMQPPDDTTFQAFQEEQTHFAMRDYGMNLLTNNLGVIQAYLSTNGAPTGYVLPAGLAKAIEGGRIKATGCALPDWRGRPVTMICFKTGRSLPGNPGSDLWFFVGDARTMKHPPAQLTITPLPSSTPVTMAAWTVGDKVYLVSGLGDAEFLKPYL